MKEEIMKNKEGIRKILTVIKYLFAVLLTLVAFKKSDDVHYLVAGMLELLIIFFVTNLLLKVKAWGHVVNDILMLLYNAQMMVLIFGNSYITMVMLTNIVSIESLAGKAVLYISGVVLTVIFSILPVCRLEWKEKYNGIGIVCAILLECIMVIGVGNAYSPLYGYVNIGMQHYEKQKALKVISAAVREQDMDMVDSEFYRAGVEGYIDKNENLAEQPNVILIFTEGLSKHIVDDERNIMPNVAKLQEESISFVNYYNHTFATYRGLLGQLYSGYQLADFDSSELVSIQSILSDQGYNTTFINAEPYNDDFANYLNNFDFDRLLGDTSMECRGTSLGLADKDAYAFLYDTAVEMVQEEKPFFLAIYTYGTHTSFDSIDEKFEDGKDAVLNRFYDADYQFGLFWEKIKSNPEFDNTILIYTADHATYQDDAFDGAFPNYKRAFQCMDEIPFYIYHKGVEPQVVDAAGRNTLDMVPTVLDYMDLSAPNYFLGTSLFAKAASSSLETSYCDSYTNYSSLNDEINVMGAEDAQYVNDTIRNYYITRELAVKQSQMEQSASADTEK